MHLKSLLGNKKIYSFTLKFKVLYAMKIRAIILESLYELSKRPYRKFVKRSRLWTVTLPELLTYPQTSLGFHLACFLLAHSFEMQPKLESHDVFHVLTGIGTSVPEEIGMQYYLLGNGKRSLYLYTVVLMGSLFYPDHLGSFHRAYVRGKSALPFHQLDFSKLLQQPLTRIQSTFLIL